MYPKTRSLGSLSQIAIDFALHLMEGSDMKIELLEGNHLIVDLEVGQVVLVNNEVVRVDKIVNDYSFVGQSLEGNGMGRFISETPFVRKVMVLE